MFDFAAARAAALMLDEKAGAGGGEAVDEVAAAGFAEGGPAGLRDFREIAG